MGDTGSGKEEASAATAADRAALPGAGSWPTGEERRPLADRLHRPSKGRRERDTPGKFVRAESGVPAVILFSGLRVSLEICILLITSLPDITLKPTLIQFHLKLESWRFIGLLGKREVNSLNVLT